MRLPKLAAFAFMPMACGYACAAIPDSVAVYAVDNGNGSIFIKNNVVYSKSFKVTISNFSEAEIQLDRVCLKAFSPDGERFKLDTVDENLATGRLKRGASVEGGVVFISESASIERATLIKLSDDCK